MLQQLIVYTALIGALGYVVYRIYLSVKKQQACNKCALMDVSQHKKSVSKNNI
jgi:CRISPR/Cas system-associated protein Cas5 (RAMP superfamily)